MMKIENLRHFSDILTIVPVRRVARGARFRRSVDRNLFRSPQGGAIPRVFIAVLRYVDPCPGLPCRARRPFPAERRPKFISVTVLVARFWECSTPSNWFNLYGNCYISVIAWDARLRECSTLSIGFNLYENCYNPVCALAVGLMEIENLFRSTALAVGLKPSASQGEARLRGL